MAPPFLDHLLPARAFATRMVCLALIAWPLGCTPASDTASEAEGDNEPSPGAAGAASAGSNDGPTRGGATSSPTGDVTSGNGAAGAAAAASDDTPDVAAPEVGGAGAAGNANAAPPSAPPAPAQAFEACTQRGGAYDDCDTIYVTMQQSAPARCVQLTIDDCGGYGRQGLSADVPNPWRLASGSVTSSLSPCELGVFNPSSSSISDASGSISWNETTTLPTALVLDLTLQPASVANDTASISVATTEPLEPVDCED
jgi:hypothetical protein